MNARIWSVILLLVLSQIVATADRTTLSIAIAVDDFKNYFKLTDTQRGDISSAFFLTYAFLQVPGGFLTDRLGVKKTLALGFFIWTMASAVTGLATTVWQLVACRLLLGVGESVLIPSGLRWIRYNIPEQRRGLVVGIYMAGSKFGPALGAVAAASLVAAYDWRAMFLIIGFGSLVWLVPWLMFTRDDDRQLEAAGHQKSGTAPVPLSQVFKTPAIYGIIIGTFSYNYFMFFCVTWLPAYFREQWKLTVEEMGTFTAFTFSGMAITAIVAGALADWLITRGANPIKVRKSFTLAGFAVASTEVIGVLSGSRDLALTFAIVSLAGLGLATANYWTLTQTLMPGAAVGRIVGVQNFASTSSGILAPLITGRLIQMTGSYEAPMIAVAILLGCGFAAYLFLVRPKYAPKAAPVKVMAAV